MWWVAAMVLIAYTILFGVFKHAFLTRWHLLALVDLALMLLMFVLRWGVYLEAFVGSYSANVFFDFLTLLFQLALVTDMLFLWLYEYNRFTRMTLVRRSSFCYTLILQPSFSLWIIAAVRAVVSTGLLAVAVFYAAEETKNQEFVGRMYFVAHLVALIFYAVFPIAIFNALLSAYSYSKKVRKSGRRVLREISFSYLYVPAGAVVYFFIFALWLVISRQNLGLQRTTSGIVSIQIDTHEAMKTPLFAVAILLVLAFRIRDYQEMRDLAMFSDDEEEALEQTARTTARAPGGAMPIVRKVSRESYVHYPVQDPGSADDPHSSEYTFATDATMSTETTTDDGSGSGSSSSSS
ncbi:uncharacterized protein AMSG_04267 [Thecamonas trahens ATCC 50062]|uniref:Transmembrane protein n=1 Tax=Thecamonas trahens ATCC 50062 TaxID=461836 RepID=A0A0L0D6R0_THETB|nr:hypothetical protein AMSG_04267 [Thecamonas trahens ATCC 50062]KNC48034.1 hypothetical protein AMSG_04267 [Thecamonas trahens ATCC 50062]|eukprot:XP_013759049.1 hypothetical protein AMSG_04267 [Thecamonas trahens ATCC 50062]